MRASDPSSSRSCAGTIAISATLASVARISGHTGLGHCLTGIGPTYASQPPALRFAGLFHQPCVVSLSCVPV